MNWTDRIAEYCKEYDINIEYLADTLYEPKVVPMIRGKAFEFSVLSALRQTLPSDKWQVDKPLLNPQLEAHDTDVRVTHLATEKVIRVECKLAQNAGYRFLKKGESRVRVKCMRSRTLGVEVIKKLALKWKVSEKLLLAHKDSYRVRDFDVVVTCLGNAFYRTNKQANRFEWKPSDSEENFLREIGGGDDLKTFAFEWMCAAKANDLAVLSKNKTNCSRRNCSSKSNCGFIPNYPIVEFESASKKPSHPWVHLEDIENLMLSFVQKRAG